MLSIDLFDSKYEKKLHEGAVDRLEQHRIDVLNDRMQELLARAKESSYKNDPAALAGLKREYQRFKDERDSYYKIREAQKGQDIVDRSAKMKALTPAKPGVAGAVKDVAQGLKSFLQGKPETGPTYEADQKKSLELDHGVIPTEPLPEHGGGIGPRQHWQDLMPEGWSDKFDLTPYGVYIDGRQWKEFKSDEHARAVADKVRASLEKQGRKQTVTIAPSEAWQKQRRIREGVVQDALKDYLGVTGTDDADAVRAAIDKIGRDPSLKPTSKRRLIGQIGMMVNKYQVPVGHKYYQYMQSFMEENKSIIEAEEIKTKQDYHNAMNQVDRQIKMETNPVNQQILRKKKDLLSQHAQAHGWIKSKEINENSEPSPAESAILRRIFVAHQDLLMNYGPEKVIQAAEEVAYNVSDADEIGTSDVSGWVRQVEQILGARP